MPTRLVLIEDHPALRTGLAHLLSERGCEIAGVAGDADAAYGAVAAQAPDVALVCVDVGTGGGGIALTRRLLAAWPGCRVVLYSRGDDGAMLHDGLAAGACGFVLSCGNVDDVVEAVRSVAAGLRWIDPRLREAFAAPRPPSLSKREREVVERLAQGLTGEQVAELLVISAETVKTHIRNAMTKLDASTRAHAVALALRDGEIQAPPAFVAAPVDARVLARAR